MWLRKQTHQQQRPPPATAASSNIPSANPDRMDPHRTIARKATAVAQPYVEEEEEEEEEEEDEEDDVVEVYDSEESSEAGTESLTWISWFCSRAGNDYFAEVAEEYVEDDFNLTGLSNLVPFYKEALELILDMEPEDDQSPDIPDPAVVETSAELLYGLIHQRFILTRQGLLQMMEKYEAGHFGFCPRVYCERARVLPVGISDLQGVDTVKLYCPSCYDLYTPAFSRYHDIDGAYFGTTFPHLLFEQVPEAASAAREQPLNIYVPRIFGFRVSERSRSGPRMQWLRWRPEDGQVEEETGDTE